MLDFRTLRRNRRPNDYLMAPDGLCQNAHPDKISATYPAQPHRLIDAYRRFFADMPRCKIAATADDGLGLEIVQKSRSIGFPDLISIRVFDDGAGRSVPAIYSRARFGWSDFGVNRARVLVSIGGVAVALAELNREE